MNTFQSINVSLANGIIQVSAKVRKKKKGTPVYSGVPLLRKLSVGSVTESLSRLDGTNKLPEMSMFDKQVEGLKRKWNL